MMSSKEHNTEIGRLGEGFAKKYLQRKGYKVLQQNYRTRYAEIDLVVRKKDMLVVVEVRTKTGERFGTPEETLNKKKLEKVKKNAAAYAAQSKWSKLYRIDAVCIVLGGNKTIERISHYENI
jgi:putative endonuclease